MLTAVCICRNPQHHQLQYHRRRARRTQGWCANGATSNRTYWSNNPGVAMRANRKYCNNPARVAHQNWISEEEPHADALAIIEQLATQVKIEETTVERETLSAIEPPSNLELPKSARLKSVVEAGCSKGKEVEETNQRKKLSISLACHRHTEQRKKLGTSALVATIQWLIQLLKRLIMCWMPMKTTDSSRGVYTMRRGR